MGPGICPRLFRFLSPRHRSNAGYWHALTPTTIAPSPTPCHQRLPGLQDVRGDEVWAPLVSCPAQLPMELVSLCFLQRHEKET